MQNKKKKYRKFKEIKIPQSCAPGMKMVRIFFDLIRDRIRLEGFRFVRIRVWIFNIRYHICIRILKSHIYNVDI
jgi:hypothetical protein